MDFTYETLMGMKNINFDNAARDWHIDIRNFWASHNDRMYEFYILPKKLNITDGMNVLEIGAEYYSKHIKSILGENYELYLLDKKDYEHPDIYNVLDIRKFIQFDLTTQMNEYNDYFDRIITFGVLSHYDFTSEQIGIYLNNLATMLKPDGLCALKIDVQIMQKMKNYNSVSGLVSIIKNVFSVIETDSIYDQNGNLQFVVMYCKQKEKVCGA